MNQRKGPRTGHWRHEPPRLLSNVRLPILANASALLAPSLVLPQLRIHLPELWWSSRSCNANARFAPPQSANRLTDRPKAGTFLQIKPVTTIAPRPCPESSGL
ncbi:uncharacterized protein TrAFT101_003035 [Trichoderma asperellum]|uniref:uncharacterized protein n=1 Tax=Trichoderma asperellum TaxID=101201 RepID=UPI00332300E9|nr:hypothetical protein TrAFT101_003035 [Trichoderma asperellum]